MKTYFIATLLLLAGSSGFCQQNNFSLKGKINGQDNGMIYLYLINDAKLNKDSATIQHGAFEFKGKLNEPTEAFLSTNKNAQSQYEPTSGLIYLEPAAMTVEISAGDFKKLSVTGSETHAEYREADKPVQVILQESKTLNDEYNQLNMAFINAKNAGKTDSELDELKNKAQAMHDQLSVYGERIHNANMAFIDTHPKSYYTAYLLRYYVPSMKLQQANAYYNKLPDNVKQSSFGKILQSDIKTLQGGSPGSEAFVFSKNDLKGEKFDLADYKGKKYVLIDFWASWCVPCRAGNPHLLSLYSKYKDKGLEIVGVADNDHDLEDWKKAVDKDGIGVWRHVLRGIIFTPTGYDKTNDISEHYGIQSLPTKILVDKTGKIIGRFGDGGDNEEDMDKMLASVFNN
ncbi:MAG: Peroxiredoxin [Mucilaginibacter sp.]|nr:Peroxiredoxin [Mucilaginibacter sp.]